MQLECPADFVPGKEQIVSCCGRSKGGLAKQKDDPCSLPRRRHSEEAYYRWRKEYGGLKQG